MRNLSFKWVLLFFILTINCNETVTSDEPVHNIVIEATVSDSWMKQKISGSFLKSNLEMKYAVTTELAFKPEWHVIKAKVSNGKAKWLIYSSKPIKVVSVPCSFNMVNPGDSITINFSPNESLFSGKGSEKVRIWAHIRQAEEMIAKPPKDYLAVTSVNEYLAWDRHSSALLQMQQQILDSCTNLLSKEEYDYMKAEIIGASVGNRLSAFESLQSSFFKRKPEGLSASDLCAIWDSTQYRAGSTWLMSQTYFSGPIYLISLFNELETFRRLEYNPANDTLLSSHKRTYAFYTSASQKYKMQVRERLMAYIIAQRVLYKLQPEDPFYQMMMTDYYTQPGFPEYKDWVKYLESKIKKKASS